jgi:polar amino acid transport system substrate-binding protein
LSASRQRIAWLVIAAMLGVCSAAHADSLTLYINQPLVKHGKTGATDAAAQVMNKAGIAFRIEGLPWSRAYANALRDPNGCVFPTDRTEDRMPLFKWAGPVVHDAWAALSLPGSTKKLSSVDDLKSARVAAYAIAETPLGKFLARYGINYFAVTNDDLDSYIPKLLESGRADYYVGHVATGAVRPDKLKVALVLSEADQFLACNPSVSDELMGRLNEAARSLIDKP